MQSLPCMAAKRRAARCCRLLAAAALCVAAAPVALQGTFAALPAFQSATRSGSADLGASASRGPSRLAPRASSAVVLEAAKKKAPAAKGADAIKDGDVIFLKGPKGNFLNAEENSENVKARASIRAPRAHLTIEKEGGGAISHGDKVYIKGFKGGYVDIQGDMVRLVYKDRSRVAGLEIWKEQGTGQGVISSGDVVYLKGGERSTYIDVEGQDVRARWPDEGKWQRMTVEV